MKARHKIQVKIIRCDNAGENKVLERESDKNELGIVFEYTAPGTPQQNGVVERAFVTVMGRARAMMNHAGFTMAKRQQLWYSICMSILNTPNKRESHGLLDGITIK